MSQAERDGTATGAKRAKRAVEPAGDGLAQELRRLRKKHGISQRALADEVDCSRTTIAAIERGSYDPTVSMLRRLSAVLDTSPGKMLSAAERIDARQAAKDKAAET